MTTNRFESLRALLEKGKFFKLICGAGNENSEEVRRLAVIYTLAGATGFDVSATPSVVSSCKAGIDTAIRLAPQLGVDVSLRPFITVSVGMPGDHHVRKAIIDLTNAQTQIRLHRETVATALENRRVVQAGYLAGKENLNRLNEAQRDLITADADLALARIRLRQAWSDLHAAAANP